MSRPDARRGGGGGRGGSGRKGGRRGNGKKGGEVAEKVRSKLIQSKAFVNDNSSPSLYIRKS